MACLRIIIILFTLGLIQNGFGQNVVYVKGKVTQKFNRKRKTLQKGDHIPYGSEISTSRDSFLILTFSTGSKLKIDPNTRITLERPIKFQGEKQNKIDLARGAITMLFKRKEKGEHLIIERKNLALAVRGTTFLMGQDGSDVYASVKEGKISMIDKKSLDYEDILGGESIIVERGRTLTKPTQFDWGNNLNFGFDVNSGPSGFFEKELRLARKSEIKRMIDQLKNSKDLLKKG